MKTASFLSTILCTTAAVLLAAAASSSAQTVIASLPYTITTGGLYVLNGNLSSSLANNVLVSINASNVTLDLQGHYISGPVGNNSQITLGIYAQERSNVTIKNGTIANCYQGIVITGTGAATTNNVDAIIDSMRVTYCTSKGIEMTNAPAGRITNCQVSQTGFSGAPYAYGIDINGPGVTVQGNTVSNVVASVGSASVCIFSDTGTFARQNQVSGATDGVIYGIYQDNLAHGCNVSFGSGTDAGGNVHD